MNVANNPVESPRQAYVIVCGNEKGGSGKTTTAMHLLVALLNAGHRVASIDLDSRQLSLTRYIENRSNWSRRKGLRLPLPTHFKLDRAPYDSISENENAELGQFQQILEQAEYNNDFILIDTPGHDSYAMRLAHSMADTLVTPVNDSFVDFDVLGQIDPDTGELVSVSHYAQMVRSARRHRRTVDNGLLDWVVVRNRLSHMVSRNNLKLAESLQELAMRLGCRLAEGISERVVFREFFPVGMTALDEMNEDSLGAGPTISHLSARREVRQLLSVLRLPIDETGKRRARARQLWLQGSARQAEHLDLLAD